MRPLKQLDNPSLSALKIALDGHQRYTDTSPEPAGYFSRIIAALIGPAEAVDVWTVRSLIQTEDQRRIRSATVKVVSQESYQVLQSLSNRERTVLQLIGEGHRPEVTADMLGISYRTLANYKANLTAKLGLGSARDLRKYAIDNLTLL